MTLFNYIPLLIFSAFVQLALLEIGIRMVKRSNNRRNVERIKRKYAEHKASIKN